MSASPYRMFDDSEGIYNYCPAPVRVDRDTMYVFYCANTWPGIVIDDIYGRKGKLVEGRWEFGDRFLALTPSRTGWDCIHVCDPDVIKGQFNWKGETYSWMMVYLGCDIHYCYHNQIGIAFAKDIAGPYIKYDRNPIVSYDELYHWGAGQPCVLSLDGKGKFRMLYTQTVHEYARHYEKPRTFWRDFDLHDADAPVVGEAVAMHDGGIANLGGEGKAEVFNPAIVWDRMRDHYYLAREGTPFDRERMPNFIASYTQICSISRQQFESNEGGWCTMRNIGAADSGFQRNHNAGVCKDAFGWLYEEAVLPVALTVSAVQDDGFLWTYRIHYTEIPLQED
ncbi:hypothetical protein M6D81_03260 [Paenibacillus sp. J5C_2022]|uniref:hypothetical protein n=1 Tax=Paenibacillus sp. J5C2022 TaxID=2977129 RepID=UPI0021CE5248|nr:hypothetical protein [Paenibacillus sp. J5C2022]MCU6707718.1 hypothetical protein [Paenibacillus sp. J5C2022]